MKVLILAEYYPRAADPTLGVWAHRQAVAARDAGAEVQVLVLHRPLPSLADVRALDVGAAVRALRQPPTIELEGIRIDYLRYLSPPRPLSYPQWGAWAAPVLRRALRTVRARFPFTLAHAHYAVPAGDALRRAAPSVPLIVSVHGGDVLGPHAGSAPVARTLHHARLVLANSAGTARRCTQRGAVRTRVVHLGTDLPPIAPPPPASPVLVTVANLIGRKRHADVIDALALLRDRHPRLRWVVIGDGPERDALQAHATSAGVAERIEWRGRLDHPTALSAARQATLFVLPSVDEAFGVAYVEAMAAGVPAIGCAGEDGPSEIVGSGGGMTLVAPRDPVALAASIDGLLSDPARLQTLRAAARATVADAFTWTRCGAETVAAYAEVSGG